VTSVTDRILGRTPTFTGWGARTYRTFQFLEEQLFFTNVKHWG